MPFKANAARRHHIPKQKRKVANWADYNASLRQREADVMVPTQRDRNLTCIAEKGRMGWQKSSGYNIRSRV